MARAKAYPIARRLSARPDIKSADKPLLIEVCSLYHNGGRTVCDATNKHFSERLGEAKETISRRLSRLAVAGWLTVDEGKAAGFARTLTPTTKCLACYLPADELAPLLTTPSIAIDQAVNSPLLTECGGAIDQNGDPLLTVYGIAIDHLCVSLLIVLEEAVKEQKELALNVDRVRDLRSGLSECENELADAQKKIAQLEADLTAARQASHTGGAAGLTGAPGGQWGKYDPTAIADNLILPFDTPEFLQAWAAYRQFREESGQHRLTGGMQEQEALRHLGNLAAGSQQAAIEALSYTIRNGYKSICKPNAARPSTPAAPGLSGGGGKPTGTAADLAEAATRRRFQRDSGRTDVQVQGAYAGQSPTGSAGVGPH